MRRLVQGVGRPCMARHTANIGLRMWGRGRHVTHAARDSRETLWQAIVRTLHPPSPPPAPWGDLSEQSCAAKHEDIAIRMWIVSSDSVHGRMVGEAFACNCKWRGPRVC